MIIELTISSLFHNTGMVLKKKKKKTGKNINRRPYHWKAQ